jgi:hypothetical protein
MHPPTCKLAQFDHLAEAAVFTRHHIGLQRGVSPIFFFISHAVSVSIWVTIAVHYVIAKNISSISITGSTFVDQNNLNKSGAIR